ncbi:MAG: DUF5668 domain-containing protein [Chloroherpetonaceae bacterium]|nr:DUF5668 domain-containing protein [Chloroherpetonaceae bacterium]MCS7212350.1 DUF5668 domain-containing protein [Chloroherpetonaceae bacterium]MDW8019421.1 DUF5668 domain-containing protein [Chloroherpetonaceae bacterium]
MKQRKIFLGSFLVVSGIIFFLRNLDLFPLELGYASRYWAVILILIGGSLLIENQLLKGILTGGAAAVLALVLWSSIFNFKGFWKSRVTEISGFPKSAKSYFLSEDFDSTTQRVKLKIDAGVGEYTLADTTTGYLILAEAYTNFGDYALKRERHQGYDELSLKIKPESVSFGWGISLKNRVTLQLNPNPIWELELDAGASSVDFDLSKLKVEKLSIGAGASSVDLKLGDLAKELFVRIDAGAASLDISLPKSVGCKIESRGALASHDFEGFMRKGRDYYTENFESSAKKIYIDIDSGVSSISIHRY